MKDILEEIIACKQKEIENLRQIVKEDILCDNCLAQRPRRSMRKALVSVPYGIIAEFKRKSPSKGWIKKEGRSDIIPPDYERNGASALSILTDTPFFGGSLHDIAIARPLTKRPILRKDFIIDEYQLYQTRIIGADAVLLIAAALTPKKCRTGSQSPRTGTGSLVGNPPGGRTRLHKRKYRYDRYQQPQSGQLPHRRGKLFPPDRKIAPGNGQSIGKRHLRPRKDKSLT